MSRRTKDIENFQKIDKYLMISHSQEQVIDQLRLWGLLKQHHEMLCEECNQQMRWEVDIVGQIDAGRYRCYGCKKSISLRKGSIFFGSQMSLPFLFRVMFHHFIYQSSIEYLHSSFGLDYKTVGRIYAYIRMVISTSIEESYEQQLGEEHILEYSLDRLRLDRLSPEEVDDHTKYSPAVEIDETLLTHFKNIDGKTQSQCWAIGIYDRGTKRHIIKAVGKNRDEAIIRDLVIRYVANDPLYPTRVYTDHFRSYNFLANEGYEHIKINHSKGYGRAANTTNHIESLWSELKSMNLFDSGFNTNDIDLVQIRINEAVWRMTRKENDLAVDLAEILGSVNTPLQQNY
ncbi:hypothetical protein ABPG72_017111 [Tetrahymena utriculariae]